MAKDILLYGEIWKYSALYFFEQIKEALQEDPSAEMTLRINTEGGDPDYAMGMIAKIQELPDQFEIKGEAMLHSLGLFFLCYVPKSKIEILDVSKAVLHRAAYPSWLESMAGFKESISYDILAKVNKDLEKAFRARVDVDVLENLPQLKSKDITLKDIFSLESRVEVLLTASDLKKIGLVDSITKITPTKSVEMSARVDAFKKCRSLEEFKLAAKSAPSNDHESNNTTMTLEELKAKHPELHAQIVKAAAAAERERVEAWLEFLDVDAEAVTKGIKEGKELTMKSMAEFTRKGMNASALKKVKDDSAADVSTDEVDEAEEGKKKKTAAEQEVAALEADVRKMVLAKK
jgi:ATP-dependent protease ClpP protease subunit